MGGLLLKKQASITWRSARQLRAEPAPQSAHWRKAGRVGSLPHIPLEPCRGPPSLCAEGVHAALVSLRGDFGKPSALMGLRREMCDSETDFWELGPK